MRISGCHPGRKHFAKGKCANCWKRDYYGTADQRAKKHAWFKRYYAQNRSRMIDAAKENLVRRTYALTMPEYNAILERPCGICGAESKHLDHCHKTGKVRGGLCVMCNVGLGSFRDDKTLLLRAVDYLDKFTVR